MALISASAPIPILPNDLIEYILNLAELPLPTRLSFIEYGIYLTPYYLLPDSLIERELYDIHKYQSNKFQEYLTLSKKNKENNCKYDNTIPVYTLVHQPAIDCEIRITELDGDIIFHFERLVIDYETEDIHVLRATVSNANTGEVLNQIENPYPPTPAPSPSSDYYDTDSD
jgi:hypothetical protein